MIIFTKAKQFSLLITYGVSGGADEYTAWVGLLFANHSTVSACINACTIELTRTGCEFWHVDRKFLYQI